QKAHISYNIQVAIMFRTSAFLANSPWTNLRSFKIMRLRESEQTGTKSQGFVDKCTTNMKQPWRDSG
ncbi:hypothetical protein KI387_001370, partial [Taxus chinensis]